MIVPYLNAFKTDLFLSANESDVRDAINANIAAGIICSYFDLPINPDSDIEQVRIAFDGDAVIFPDESERIYQAQGLQVFADYKYKNSQKPLPEGSFAKFLKTLSVIQQRFEERPAPNELLLLPPETHQLTSE